MATSGTRVRAVVNELLKVTEKNLGCMGELHRASGTPRLDAANGLVGGNSLS